jgi:hypothetical protein
MLEKTADRPPRQTRALFRRSGLIEIMKTCFLSTGRTARNLVRPALSLCTLARTSMNPSF